MHFEPGHTYHVYNKGNHKIRIFFSEFNYLYFLRKISIEWKNYCDILCYALMPNHFHFILQPNEEGCRNLVLSEKYSNLQVLSKVIGKSLSSYTQAINKQNKTTGSLFQKKTKAKCLTDVSICRDDITISEYLINCFHYIHNNPIASILVKNLDDWPWTSWHEYNGNIADGICNIKLGKELFGEHLLTYSGISGGLNGQVISSIW